MLLNDKIPIARSRFKEAATTVGIGPAVGTALEAAATNIVLQSTKLLATQFLKKADFSSAAALLPHYRAVEAIQARLFKPLQFAALTLPAFVALGDAVERNPRLPVGATARRLHGFWLATKGGAAFLAPTIAADLPRAIGNLAEGRHLLFSSAELGIAAVAAFSLLFAALKITRSYRDSVSHHQKNLARIAGKKQPVVTRMDSERERATRTQRAQVRRASAEAAVKSGARREKDS